MSEIAVLRQMVRGSDNIVFFGGAGVSTESGIPDFRSSDGVFKLLGGISPEKALSRSHFDENPEAFFNFYRKTMVFPNAKPNMAHDKLAELEQAGKVRAVITQNIDGLHQKAGSRTVIELHGSAERNYCMDCERKYPMAFVLDSDGIPRCVCGGIVRPDIVMYEEPLDHRTKRLAYNFIDEADMLIVAGSSLVVYPAAGFVRDFHGRYLVLINRSDTPYDGKANLVIRGSVGEVLNLL